MGLFIRLLSFSDKPPTPTVAIEQPKFDSQARKTPPTEGEDAVDSPPATETSNEASQAVSPVNVASGNASNNPSPTEGQQQSATASLSIYDQFEARDDGEEEDEGIVEHREETLESPLTDTGLSTTSSKTSIGVISGRGSAGSFGEAGQEAGRPSSRSSSGDQRVSPKPRSSPKQAATGEERGLFGSHAIASSAPLTTSQLSSSSSGQGQSGPSSRQRVSTIDSPPVRQSPQTSAAEVVEWSEGAEISSPSSKSPTAEPVQSTPAAEEEGMSIFERRVYLARNTCISPCSKTVDNVTKVFDPERFNMQ